MSTPSQPIIVHELRNILSAKSCSNVVITTIFHGLPRERVLMEYFFGNKTEKRAPIIGFKFRLQNLLPRSMHKYAKTPIHITIIPKKEKRRYIVKVQGQNLRSKILFVFQVLMEIFESLLSPRDAMDLRMEKYEVENSISVSKLNTRIRDFYIYARELKELVNFNGLKFSQLIFPSPSGNEKRVKTNNLSNQGQSTKAGLKNAAEGRATERYVEAMLRMYPRGPFGPSNMEEEDIFQRQKFDTRDKTFRKYVKKSYNYFPVKDSHVQNKQFNISSTDLGNGRREYLRLSKYGIKKGWYPSLCYYSQQAKNFRRVYSQRQFEERFSPKPNVFEST